MMSKVLLFWMVYPPDPNMDYEEWVGFCEPMAGWVVVCWLVTTAAIIGCYWQHARQKKISRWQDVYEPYTPMCWLWLAIIPGIVVFFAYMIDYRTLFPDATVSFMAGAPQVGLWTILLTFLLAYPLLWLPGITPAKYRYRPRWLLYRKRRAWRSSQDSGEDK